MREILFRGKTTRGEWLYGAPVEVAEFVEIHFFELDEWKMEERLVYSESVGQYVGIKDINGKKIFEGDIVKFKRVNALGYTTSRVGEVKYYDELPIFYIYANTGDAWDWVECEEIEVVGNIHDNPELMERWRD